MDATVAVILTSSVVGVTISSVFAFVQFLITRKDEKNKAKVEDLKDIEDRLGKLSDICMGLAYDRIMHVGSTYLSKGYITIDEREDFRKYLWGPYHNAGGNGSGDAMMRQIDQLPVRKGKANE